MHMRRASPACAKSESLHSKSDDERKGVERILHTPGASPAYARSESRIREERILHARRASPAHVKSEFFTREEHVLHVR